MIYQRFLRHLPLWLAVPLTTATYLIGMLALWWFWDVNSAPFRYLGL